jgi:hypothetical protein
MELLSRELKVTAALFSDWRDWVERAAEPARKERTRRPPRRRTSGQGWRYDDGERITVREDRSSGGWLPFGTAEVETMSQVI